MSQTLAFDIYGTLINTSGVFAKLNEMIGDRAEAVMKSWRQKQLEYSFRRGLMRRHRDFSVCTNDALIYACKSLNVELNEKQQNELLHQYTILPIYSDVKECLNACRNQRHRLYAFSNGSKSAVRQLLEYNRILSFFDGIVSTEEVKMFKPSPDVYQHFTETTGSEASGTWLISGNSFDVMGARACNWNAAWVQRSDDNIFDPWEEFSPTATVQSLNELPDVLDKS
jgi:2-haloacid dehalogenase